MAWVREARGPRGGYGHSVPSPDKYPSTKLQLQTIGYEKHEPPPRTVWTPQLRMHHWLGFTNSAAYGDDSVPNPGQNVFLHIRLKRLGEISSGLPGRYRPAGRGNPNNECTIGWGLEFMKPVAQGEDFGCIPGQITSHIYTYTTHRGRKRRAPWTIRPERYGDPNSGYIIGWGW